VTNTRLRINPIINAISRLRKRIRNLKLAPGFSAINGNESEAVDEVVNRLVDVADGGGGGGGMDIF
jgi:hypothetical protein